MKKVFSILLISLTLAAPGCSKNKSSSSDQHGSPVNKTISMPAEKTTHVTDKEPNQDLKKEPKGGGEAPCCKSEGIHFDGLDLHTKFLGLPQNIESNKKYKAELEIQGDHEGVDAYQLQVKAMMKGMDHDVRFKTSKKSERQFLIEPIVFSMDGSWDVVYSWIDANGEVVDTCECKIDVRSENK